MKLLYLCSDLGIPVLGRKGASVHVRGLASALGRAGHSVVVAGAVLDKSPWEPSADLDVAIVHVPLAQPTYETVLAIKAYAEKLGAADSLPGELRRILWNQQAAIELKRRFDSHRPDLIYERVSLYATVGTVLGDELDVPVIEELNAPVSSEHSTYRATALGELGAHAERFALQRADAVVAVSEPLREHALEVGVSPQRVHVLPNAVDPHLFHPGPSDPGVRSRWGLSDGPVLGFVGGLRPWHGVMMLPALLDRLAPEHRGLQLVVAGDGPLRGELAEELRDRGLKDRAILTGSLDHHEIPALVREFDVALAPYDQLDHRFYFSPLKVFEYMACAKPVVAAAAGQLAAVIEDGGAGLTYPPGDLDAATEACGRLLADPELLRRQGEAGVRLTRDRHTWARNAARVTEIAHSLIESRRCER